MREKLSKEILMEASKSMDNEAQELFSSLVFLILIFFCKSKYKADMHTPTREKHYPQFWESTDY